MPHFHISVQSGDDLILKRMKRRHCRADIERFVDRVRALRPDAAFGADPASAGFARLMCASVASETSDGNDGASQRRERAALASFCESALRECARREAPDAAAAYVPGGHVRQSSSRVSLEK